MLVEEVVKVGEIWEREERITTRIILIYICKKE